MLVHGGRIESCAQATWDTENKKPRLINSISQNLTFLKLDIEIFKLIIGKILLHGHAELTIGLADKIQSFISAG